MRPATLTNDGTDLYSTIQASGAAPSSLLTKILRKNEKGELGEYVIKRSVAMIHIGKVFALCSALLNSLN